MQKPSGENARIVLRAVVIPAQVYGRTDLGSRGRAERHRRAAEEARPGPT